MLHIALALILSYNIQHKLSCLANKSAQPRIHAKKTNKKNNNNNNKKNYSSLEIRGNCTFKIYSAKFPQARSVARISRRGGSKLVPTKTVGLKSLHYVRTGLRRLRKQKTPWLPLSERVYRFLDIYASVVIDVHQCQPRLSLA